MQRGLSTIAENRRSRRAFLGTALAAGASSAVVAGGSVVEAATNANSQSVLPYAKDPNWVKNHFVNIINNEIAHLRTLTSQLGVFARPAPSFVNISVSNLTQYVTLGAKFCSIGAGAYLGAAPYLQNPAIVAEAGSIGQVELTQSGYLYSLLDQTFLPGGSPFGVPLTLPQILDALAPYVSSLNGGPEPIFSTTAPSLENDIAILNVALIQEYLEVEFYSSNFTKIFG